MSDIIHTETEIYMTNQIRYKVIVGDKSIEEIIELLLKDGAPNDVIRVTMERKYRKEKHKNMVGHAGIPWKQGHSRFDGQPWENM